MLQKILMNAQNEISWTKLGVLIIAIASASLSVGVCPVLLIPYAKMVIAIGAIITGAGVRDAIGSPVVPPTTPK
jgi:hypothetical protein